MIGQQPTGAVPGVVITAVAHEGLRVLVNGRPARLAIVDENGAIVAEGDRVAREAEAVAINEYKATMRGLGHLRVWGKDLRPSK